MREWKTSRSVAERRPVLRFASIDGGTSTRLYHARGRGPWACQAVSDFVTFSRASATLNGQSIAQAQR